MTTTDKKEKEYYYNVSNVKTQTLWIGNLTKNVPSELLERIFSRYGKVSNCRIIPENPGSTRLYGFADFCPNNSKDMDKMFNATIIIDGVKIKIKLAKGRPSAKSQRIQRLKDYNHEKMEERRRKKEERDARWFSMAERD